MTKRIKTKLLFIGMAIFTMILNSIVDMHPNGIQLKYITAENISFVKTKFIINLYGNKIMINDNFNKVITLYGTTKDDINITTNKNC